MRKKILVVEDDFANQRVSCLFLDKLGYAADVAENGQEAIELVTVNAYRLIFMDCQMPIMDGFETAKTIRQLSGPNKDIPIIALTANVTVGTNGECENSGMNDVLNKPVMLESMKQMLTKWIK